MSGEIASKSRVTNIQRFQPLQAAQYWQARVAIKNEKIEKGDVLLIQSLRYVENEVHTVILRAHPRHYGDYWMKPVEGQKGMRQQVRLTEYRFLTVDFLNKFEFAPDADIVRAAELAAIDAKIRQLRDELEQGKTSRDKFLALAAQEEKTTNKAAESPAEENSIVPLNNEMSLATAIDTGITQEKIDNFRAMVDREGKIAQIQVKWIKEKTDEISSAVKEIAPYYQEEAAAALAQAEDVRSHVDNLLEGIGSLELYVGTDVEIIEIRKGESAPIKSPLTILQRKLYMDEELSVWAEVDEWFDFKDQNLFIEALKNHKGLVDQIFASDRCILAMATTARTQDYGDPWTNREMHKRNSNVFLLIRDGDNLYKVHSPVESHLGAARLFPATDESDKKFHGSDGSTITFRDVRYTDSLTAHEKMALHYKRFLILICGLDHRLNLFGTFYDGPKSFKFVQPEFQETYFRFIHDDDGEGMLPTETRPTFEEWIKQMNAYVRDGSRLFCSWNSIMTPDTAPGAYRSNYRGQNRVVELVERYGLGVVYKRVDELYVDVPVQQYSYKSSRNRSLNIKTLVTDTDSRHYVSALPYLCLDNIDPDALDWYIHDRNSRSNFIHFIEFFKRTVRVVRAELAEEQETRKAIAQALLAGAVAAPGEVPDIVQRTVVTWRATKRGSALPRFKDATPSERKSLLNTAYLLAGNAKNRAADIDTWISNLGFVPLRLTAAGSARMVLYTAPKSEEIDDRMFPHVWTHRFVLEPLKNGDYEVKSSNWALLPKVSASETVIHEWPEAQEWMKEAQPFHSFEQKRIMYDCIAQFEHRVGKLLQADDTYVEFLFNEWIAIRNEYSRSNVVSPSFIIPFGLSVNKLTHSYNNRLGYVGLATHYPEILLHHLAKDPAMKQKIRKEYIGIYQAKTMAAERFDKGKPTLFISLTDGHFDYDHYGFLSAGGMRTANMGWDTKYNGLDDFLSKWIDYQSDKVIWVPDAVRRPGYFGGLLQSLGLKDDSSGKN